MKQVIKRKDGITYIREVKEPNDYKTNLNIRIDEKTLNEIRGIAKSKGIGHSELIRNIFKSYIAERKGENNEK